MFCAINQTKALFFINDLYYTTELREEITVNPRQGHEETHSVCGEACHKKYEMDSKYEHKAIL